MLAEKLRKAVPGTAAYIARDLIMGRHENMHATLNDTLGLAVNDIDQKAEILIQQVAKFRKAGLIKLPEFTDPDFQTRLQDRTLVSADQKRLTAMAEQARREEEEESEEDYEDESFATTGKKSLMSPVLGPPRTSSQAIETPSLRRKKKVSVEHKQEEVVNSTSNVDQEANSSTNDHEKSEILVAELSNDSVRNSIVVSPPLSSGGKVVFEKPAIRCFGKKTMKPCKKKPVPKRNKSIVQTPESSK